MAKLSRSSVPPVMRVTPVAVAVEVALVVVVAPAVPPVVLPAAASSGLPAQAAAASARTAKGTLPHPVAGRDEGSFGRRSLLIARLYRMFDGSHAPSHVR